MKILFTRQEEKARGINFIMKSLLEATKSSGHTNGILVGIPPEKISVKNGVIKDKILHVNLQRYLGGGLESFAYFVRGGLRRRNILFSFLTLSIFNTKEMKLRNRYFLGNVDLKRNLDFVIKAPYFYQVFNKFNGFFGRKTLKNAIKKAHIDLVICVTPTRLRSKDVGKAKLVHFVHDAMPHELIESPPDNNTPQKFAKEFESAANNSDLILVNSKDTKSKVLDANPKANVHVVYGTASSSQKFATTSILEKNRLAKNGYLLFTSTLEKRKNVASLLKAYSLVVDSVGKKLVLVGGPGYGFNEIYKTYKSLPKAVQKQIVFTGYVSESDKYTLFANANAFIFPSVYEGFGLVIIEAMQHSLPIVTTRRGALPEAAGKAAHYINDPYDVGEIATAIEKIVKNSVLRNRLVKKSKTQVNKFTQENFNKRVKVALLSIKNRQV